MKEEQRPWASRSLDTDRKEPDERFLRRAARVLPRNHSEVVALGLVRFERDQGPSHRLHARTPDHAQPSTASQSCTKNGTPLSDEGLVAAVEELQKCKGSTAFFRVLGFLGKKKNTKYEIFHDKIPFKYHFGIFTSFLQNGTSIEAVKLEHAFYIYFTQAAYSLHQYRLNDQPFSKFFQSDPPSLRQQPRWVHYPNFHLGDGQMLQEFLKAETEKFSKIPEKEPLKTLIQRLLEEITEVLQIETPSPSQFWSASTPTLVQAVHAMLGEYLGQHEAFIEKIPIADDKGETLSRATNAYLNLDYFMAHTHHLIKFYMCLIDGDPGVNFNFRITSVPATKDQGFDFTDWGDCAFKWLEGVVEQARAAKWLWYARNEYVFDTEFLISNAPAAEPLHYWE